jgi:hypothetical protein
MTVRLDVIIEAGTAAPPLCVDIWLSRQRQQRAPFQSLEQRQAADPKAAHRPAIEISNQRADRRVQLGQREKPAMAQPSRHPALHNLYSDFDLGFVARAANPRR